MTKMQAAVRRARIMRPSLSWRRSSRLLAISQAQRFLSAHDQINNLFHLRRDHVTATEYRAMRTRAFELWAEITDVTAAA